MKYFLTNYDYNIDSKIGKKSIRDLFEIKLKLTQIISESRNDEMEPFRETTEQKLFYESSLYPFLSREKIDNINLSNNIFTNFHAIIIIYLFNVLSKYDNKIKVFKEKYFREEIISQTEISKLTNISRERVRQIIKNLQEYLIPKYVSQLITALKWNGTGFN
ncbi:MAG: hypothetical protein IPJ20_00055 [Flammeovirgaceae bacterium]|nr:hypothetical protein [Flammeovirgaceae bacterium]